MIAQIAGDGLRGAYSSGIAASKAPYPADTASASKDMMKVNAAAASAAPHSSNWLSQLFGAIGDFLGLDGTPFRYEGPANRHWMWDAPAAASGDDEMIYVTATHRSGEYYVPRTVSPLMAVLSAPRDNRVPSVQQLWDYENAVRAPVARAAAASTYASRVGDAFGAGWRNFQTGFNDGTLTGSIRNGLDPMGLHHITDFTAMLAGGVGAMSEPLFPDSDGDWAQLETNRAHPFFYDPQHVALGAEQRAMFGDYVVGVATSPIGGGESILARESAVTGTIADLLGDYHPDSLIHITPSSPRAFAGGIDEGTYFSRLGDVGHLTPEEFRTTVVGPIAGGYGPDANLFVIVGPEASRSFVPLPPEAVNLSGTTEYVSTRRVSASGFVRIN